MIDLSASQRQLFQILEEFFQRATGKTVDQFKSQGPFDQVVRSQARRLAARGKKAFPWVDQQLRSYYDTHKLEAFQTGGSLGGIKTVLGGSSRFQASQLASVRKMALYVDSVLIPDPILPWLEDPRAEERFRHVLLLETTFWLLHLKPLVDAQLPYPAVVVFPSWERSLEAQDPTTQQGQKQLITHFMGKHLSVQVNSFDELHRYVLEHPTEFMSASDQQGIFLAPGAGSVEPLDKGLARYRAHIAQWRSPQWMAELAKQPDSIVLLNALAERIGPFYHLLQNADELRAQPMLCLEAQWFYYSKIVELFDGQLASGGYLDAGTQTQIKAINDPTLAWLERVPVPILAKLRAANVNEDFRRRLDQWTRVLHGAGVADLDRAVAEVSRGLSGLLSEHQATVRRIQSQYQTRHKQTLVSGWVGLAATFLPALAPFIGTAAPLGLITKYAWDKLAEREDLRGAARSLTGVLAKARSDAPET